MWQLVRVALIGAVLHFELGTETHDGSHLAKMPTTCFVRMKTREKVTGTASERKCEGVVMKTNVVALTGPDTVILRRNANWKIRRRLSKIKSSGQHSDAFSPVASHLSDCRSPHWWAHRGAASGIWHLSFMFGSEAETRGRVNLTGGPNSWREGGAAWKGVE